MVGLVSQVIKKQADDYVENNPARINGRIGDKKLV